MNPNKYGIMYISAKETERMHQVKLSKEKISIIKSHTYLGVNLNNKLDTVQMPI